MTVHSVVLVPLLASALLAASSRDRDQRLLAELESLRAEYRAVQNELQDAMQQRWSARERQVASKAENREKLDALRQETERLYADLARAREEALLREDALAGEREIVKRKEEEWQFVAQAVADKAEALQNRITEGFPLGREQRMARLAAIEARFPGLTAPTQKLDVLLGYMRREFARDSRIAVARRTVVLENDTPITAEVLRVGQVMAYGVQPDGSVFVLGTAGQLGKSTFEWRRVTNEEVRAVVANAVPRWVGQHRVDGMLPADVLQNRYSQALTSSTRAGWVDRFWAWAKSGGPVMVPLAGIVLWALFIIINRLVVYASRSSRSYHFINRAVELLGKGDTSGAAALANQGSGVLARVLNECLRHSQWNRASAEKAMRELLLTEVPILDRFLETLAVLAATAPLLGLLGTVTGMIRLFDAITKFGTGDPRMLSGGIAEALVTTEAGLSIAIPILLIHDFLRSRRNRLLNDMQVYAMRIINRLWPQE